ncbi:hypothetical protein [Salinicoccus halodurans]|uniref:Uncharacterized protein n=1 Tax=Salinicoccus halodurans TaxID=407035 RepID=A0A0F7HLE4_9STAP|nr:hypothetical protein [Salinicoccus halodurans]AKG74384.1 hypothetical protein AAT16_09140 [Salinicoccus halodurans]SFK95240.1 hypothetical protein SAMN05216235_2726 [Salinicoccus halodurans]
MEYKFKDEIKSAFTESFLRKNNTDELWDMQNELDETYAKAQAFDEIQKSFYEIRKDMKDKNVGYVLGYQTVGTETAKYIKKYESGDSDGSHES